MTFKMVFSMLSAIVDMTNTIQQTAVQFHPVQEMVDPIAEEMLANYTCAKTTDKLKLYFSLCCQFITVSAFA